MTKSSSLEVRFAPVAWLLGLGLAGFGVGGALGAGIALMLPASFAFLGALVDDHRGWEPGRRKKTLRHRWFLWVDQLHRQKERRRQERVARKDAERSFLERRGRGR